MKKEDYKNMSADEKAVIVTWYQMSSEALSVLKANGLNEAQALKTLRGCLTTKNLKYLK